MNRFAAVILAAGKGKRMKSDLPKVLHPVLGRPMIEHLLDTLLKQNPDRIIVVIGHQADRVRRVLSRYHDRVEFVLQERQLGTGHAVLMAEEAMEGFAGDVLVLAGDVPFLSGDSIGRLIEIHRREQAAGTVLSSVPPDPTGYGRIIRIPGTDLVARIIEHKDADEKQRMIGEINTGTFCFDSRFLFASLKEIRDDNRQKEYYLTDVMEIMRQKGLKTAVFRTDDPDEVLGINSVEQLADLEVKFVTRRDLRQASAS